MAKRLRARDLVVSQEEFSREILARVTAERPDTPVRQLNPYFLLVGRDQGKQRLVSLVRLYQNYCAAPDEKGELMDDFLASVVYDEPPVIRGDFAHNRDRILPQVVPNSLLEFSQKDDQSLATMPLGADLFVAFVVDEPERYCYISERVMEQWHVTETDLLCAAMANLRHCSQGITCHQIGTGDRAMFIFENFDGYDASRVLLGRMMAELSVKVPGNPVIGIPHRDALIVIGDTDPAFVASTAESVRQDFSGHTYPITSNLLMLAGGQLIPYERRRSAWVIN